MEQLRGGSLSPDVPALPPAGEGEAPHEHKDFKALLSRVQKWFPAKWMTAAKLLTVFKKLEADEAQRKADEAAAKKAGAAEPPPAAEMPEC